MSKRKHKNKFHFHPHASLLVGAADQQPLLPLVYTDSMASDPIPAEIAAQAPTVPLHAVSDMASDPIQVEIAAEAPTVPLCAESDMAPISTVSARLPEMHLSVPAIALDASLGQRLRAVREARSLSCEAVSHALKLPVTVVKALEAEQFERIGHGVFLRGYLSKYLQLLDLPLVLADRVVQDHAEPPPLTTNGTISHSRYLFERYSGSAMYLILTGVIVVPAVLLALRAGFDRNLASITSLDTPPPVIAAPATDRANTASFAAMDVVQPTPKSASVSTATKPEETPLVASMTPFPAVAETKSAVVSAPAVGPTNHLHLSLTQPSWVEIVDADGRKLEYGLLPAGSERDYASDQPLEIRIGNADGAALTIDGKPQDLESFRHANVAHLKIAGGAVGAAHGGG